MPPERPILILLDTNIWLEHLLLRTPLGASLLYAISRLGARILLPEVVEGELEKNIKKIAWETFAEMQRNAETLRRVTGKEVPFEIADYEGMERAAAIRLKELDPILQRAELRLEHTRAALELVNSELPPNGPKNQQFKDSLIWQAAKEFARDNRILFVTKDKGFFADRQPSRGLADNLVSEIALKELDLRVFDSAEAMLSDLEQEVPPFDTSPASAEVARKIVPYVAHEVTQQGLQILERTSDEITAFPTEHADETALTFRLRYRLVDTGARDPSEEKRDPSVTIFGEAAYNMREGTVRDVQPDRFEFEWLTAEGEKRQSTLYYAQAIIRVNPAQYL